MALDEGTGSHYNPPKRRRKPAQAVPVPLASTATPKRRKRRRKRAPVNPPGGQPYLFLPGLSHMPMGDVPGFNQTPYPSYFFGLQEPGYQGHTPLEILRRAMGNLPA